MNRSTQLGRIDSTVVARHDLRPRDAVRDFVSREAWNRPGRALVIIRGADLFDLHETLFDIAAANHVTMVCLVVGRHDGPMPPALVAPGILGGFGIATLWVSDESGAGCGWWMDSGDPLLSTEAILGASAPLALDLLDDCLMVPDVFDRVLAEIQQMVDHVACPGLVVRSGQLSAEALRSARIWALRGLNQGDGRGAGAPADLASLVPAAAGPRGQQDLDGVITPGSELASVRRAAREATEAAARQVTRLPSLGGLFVSGGHPHGAWAALRRAQAEQLRLHRFVADLLTTAHRPDGTPIDGVARSDLLDRGVQIPPDTDAVRRGKVLSQLREQTERAWQRSSIGSAQAWLRDLADRAAPRGSGAYLRELASLRPGTGEPPSFPLRPAPPWLLASTLLGSALAGLAGPAGASVAAVALLGVLLVMSRRPTPDGQSGLASALRPVLSWHLPAVAIGLGAGLLAGGYAPIPIGVRVGLAVGGAIAVLVALRSWWRSAALRWVAQVVGIAPPRLLAEHDRLLHRVIWDEWHTAGMRTFVADCAIAAAVALDRAGTVLRRREDLLTQFRGTADGGGPAQPDETLVRVLTQDLRDAVDAALAGVWDRIAAGSAGGAWEDVGRRLDETLDGYEQHLAGHDINDAPPFAPARRQRIRVDAGWGPPQHLADLLETPIDGPLVQLCENRHISLLSREHVRGVRFAPRAIQQVLTDQLAQRGRGPLLGEVAWTGSGSLLGVLRLVPPRSGVVELHWPQGGGTEPDDDGSRGDD